MGDPADDAARLSDRTILVSRTIDGPRRLVFEACSQVRHFARWYEPNGFTTTTRSFDFRVGGVWEFVMHGPDGTGYPNHVEYLEIVAPERIVMLHGDRAGDPRAFVSTFTLIERGQTAPRLAPCCHAGDVTHCGHHPAGPPVRLHRAIPQGCDAQGDVRVAASRRARRASAERSSVVRRRTGGC